MTSSASLPAPQQARVEQRVRQVDGGQGTGQLTPLISCHLA